MGRSFEQRHRFRVSYKKSRRKRVNALPLRIRTYFSGQESDQHRRGFKICPAAIIATIWHGASIPHELLDKIGIGGIIPI